MANASAHKVQLLIGGVDYSDQVFSINIPPQMLGADRSGGIIPYEGSIVLKEGVQPINERKNLGLFSPNSPVQLKIDIGGTLSDFPISLYIKTRNYSQDPESIHGRQELSVGCIWAIKATESQATDSTLVGIGVGFPGRTWQSCVTALCNSLDLIPSYLQSVYTNDLSFNYPRNFGAASSGIDSLLEATGFISYGGFGTVPNGTGDYHRVSVNERLLGDDAIAIRSIGATCDVIDFGWTSFGDGQIDIAEASGSWYAWRETDSFIAYPSVTESPYLEQVTEEFDFGPVPRIIRETTTTAPAEEIYEGLNALTGATTITEITQTDQWLSPNPGDFDTQAISHRSRFAAVAKGLKGWLIGARTKAADGTEYRYTTAQINNFINAFPWTSLGVRRLEETEVTYDNGYVSKIKKTISITLAEMLETLGNVIDWGYVIEEVGASALTSLTQLSTEITRYEKNGDVWHKTTRTRIRAIANQRENSELSHEFETANGSESDGLEPDPSQYGYLILTKGLLYTTRNPQGQSSGSYGVTPEQWPPPPPRYTAEGRQTSATVTFPTANPTYLYRRVNYSAPWCPDASATAINAESTSIRPWLAAYAARKVAYQNAHDNLGQITLPIEQWILDNWSPWMVVDYTDYDGVVYRLGLTPALSIDSGRGVITALCTLIKKL